MQQDVSLALFIVNIIVIMLMIVLFYGVFIPERHERERQNKIRELEEEYEKIFENDKPNSTT